jgi:hypothetical protein
MPCWSPGRFSISRPKQHRLGEPGLAQDRGLRAIDFFGAEIRRVDRMRIDQHDAVAGAAEHGGCRRSGQAAARNDNVGLTHALSHALS